MKILSSCEDHSFLNACLIEFGLISQADGWTVGYYTTAVGVTEPVALC